MAGKFFRWRTDFKNCLPDWRRKFFSIWRTLVAANVKTILIDFEISMLSALKKEFPGCDIRGCHFHLAQSWLRKIQPLGLFRDYKNKDSTVGKYLRKCFSLRKIKFEMVGDCFARFKTQAPDGIEQFIVYLQKNYMSPMAVFPPNMWAGVLNTTPTTTIFCETYHFHFGNMFGSSNSSPNIFKFMENVIQWNMLKKIEARSPPVKLLTATNVLDVEPTVEDILDALEIDTLPPLIR